MSNEESSSIPPPPTGVPPPTGNFAVDVYNSVTHVLQVPCARDAFLQGIMGGVGIGFIRGTTAAPIVAGHWAITSFVGITSFSWYLCQRRIQRDRQRVLEMMEHTKKTKHNDDSAHK